MKAFRMMEMRICRMIRTTAWAGDLNEDTVNDFSGFEGIWLGEADNDYDYGV